MRFFVFIAAISFSQALMLHPAPVPRFAPPQAQVPRQVRWIGEAEAASLGLPTHGFTQKENTVSLLGAIVGVSVVSFAGVFLSDAFSNINLSWLQSAGLLEQDVLWTTSLMNRVEYANMAGYVILALSLTNLIVNDEAWAPTQPILGEPEAGSEVCLTDDGEGQICGAGRVLEDGMVCVEHLSAGKPQWVCA